MRRNGLSLLLVALLLLVAGAGLAFLFGLFRELVDSSGGASFFQAISSSAPASPLRRFTSRLFLALAFSLGVLIIYFVLARGRHSYWLGALLFAVLLLLIGTPISDRLKLTRASPPEVDVGGVGTFLESGLNIRLDLGGTIPSIQDLNVPGVDPSSANSPGLSPEGAHQLLDVPVFRVSGAGHTRFLRTMSSTTYNGEVWTIDDDVKFTPLPSTTFEPRVAGFQQVYQDNITLAPITRFGRGFVPVTLHMSSLDFPVPLRFSEELWVFRSSEAVDNSYGLVASAYTFDQEFLRDLAVVPEKRYLQLPGNISERVKGLAREVTRDAASPYEQAKALEQYLKTTYAYDLGYQNAPDGWEAADWFLFEDQRGVCSNFNHAFVIMARSMGISARPVVGWAIAATDQQQEVRAYQAHQWAEVLFQDVGWLTFDATGPGGAPDRVPTPPDLEGTPVPTAAPTPSP
ncbi:MAG: transglutaminase domain-containing protein, partial [Chloroflexi bacterium]|nr:transglutaminase domain-containing protein [Chloroflexota bacterium]